MPGGEFIMLEWAFFRFFQVLPYSARDEIFHGRPLLGGADLERRKEFCGDVTQIIVFH